MCAFQDKVGLVQAYKYALHSMPQAVVDVLSASSMLLLCFLVLTAIVIFPLVIVIALLVCVFYEQPIAGFARAAFSFR